MSNNNNNTPQQQLQQQVSDHIFEYILTELSLYAESSCNSSILDVGNTSGNNNENSSIKGNAPGGGGSSSSSNNNNNSSSAGGGSNNDGNVTGSMNQQERLTVQAEMASAKVERMGYSVGYRLTERLAQNKTWNAVPNQDEAAAVAAQQLEAVKFLCKEIWVEIFHKQIDKLQTNHRGVFVLKDLDLKWLKRFPSGTEVARIAALRLLAFPCGLIRGSLSNFGIPAVVSCDFLADGQKMSSCSFNIKVK